MVRKTRNRKTRNRKTRKNGGGLGLVGKAAIGAAGLALASGYKVAPTPANYQVANYTMPELPSYTTALNRMRNIPNMSGTNVSSFPGLGTNVTSIPSQVADVSSIPNTPFEARPKVAFKCKASINTCRERARRRYPGYKPSEIIIY